ncbi:MAG: hypothetical protein QOH81_1967 [Sphingomonadales bacterium]|jgi:hypothetical protein|nr:hypothetical protein [Sphingomonadales bacterium]
MSVQQIDKSAWPGFFDIFTKSLAGKTAEIEVASLELGDQIEAGWVPLIGITYDHKDDLVEIALEGVDHMILSPREVYVDYGVGGLISLEVVDAEGVQQIVKLKDPLALPAPDQAVSAETVR